MSQLLLDFPTAESYAPQDFIPLPCNQNVLNELQRLQSGNIAFIYGPAKSGKTHLLNWWLTQNSGQWITAENPLPAAEHLALDDLQEQGRDGQERAFHAFNYTKNEGKILLITANKPASELNILPDLKSRLLTAPQLEITAPNEADLHVLITKWATDLQLNLSEDVITYILRHGERSASWNKSLITKLNQASLRQKRKPTIPLLKEII